MKYIQSGKRPGKGYYICSECNKAIYIASDSLILPVCPKCHCCYFTSHSS